MSAGITVKHSDLAMKPKSIVTNEDCMELMARYPDKYFDLAVVDPPYGLDRLQKGSLRLGGIKGNYKDKLGWDIKPTEEYFKQLFRVSKNQIVFGANNFVMPPSEYFLVWDKAQTVDNFATAEYAWVSMGLKKPAKIFRYSIHKHNQTDKIHPTQKPIALYSWILFNYIDTCDVCGGSGEIPSLSLDCDVQTCRKCKGNQPKILDTHLGSGSSRIAAYDLGFDFTGCELDKDYFDAQEKRFIEHVTRTTELRELGYAKSELNKNNPTLF